MITALRTRFCELLDIQLPIIQSGMSRVSGAELAAAVSHAGGVAALPRSD